MSARIYIYAKEGRRKHIANRLDLPEHLLTTPLCGGPPAWRLPTRVELLTGKSRLPVCMSCQRKWDALNEEADR